MFLRVFGLKGSTFKKNASSFGALIDDKANQGFINVHENG